MNPHPIVLERAPLSGPNGKAGRPELQRASGRARVAFAAGAGTTGLVEFYQSGSAKIRLPRSGPGPAREAVFLNTAGGVTGGDRLTYEAEVATGAAAVVTTQAAERVYRSLSGTARIETRLAVGAGARLDWLPQETILFDRSSLTRRLTVDIAADATFLGIETIVFGRTAMGERVRDVSLADSWRVDRAGRPAFADGLRLDGDAESVMAGSATGKGAAAVATLLLVARDAEARLEQARDALAGTAAESGASAWNGMLVARLAAPSGQILRAALVRLVERLRGAPMPRVWSS